MTARVLRLTLTAILTSLAGVAVFIPDSAAAETQGDSWRFVEVEFSPEDPGAGTVATVQFTIQDESGAPVSGLRASGLLREPSSAYDDAPPAPRLTVIGRELDEPGRYEVAVALNQPGRWWIEARVLDEDTGRIARYDHFTVVDSADEPGPATTAEPLFLRGNEWDEFYRIDPDTGSVATLEGEEIFQIGSQWWIADTRLQERGQVTREYGGTWRLEVALRNALTGNDLTTITVADIRANVFGGSSSDPAIASAVAIADDGSAIYIYWARKLGDGWVGHITEADPLTGDVRRQRVINGAISSNGFWAEIYVRNNGQLVIAEQVVEVASVSGYRLTVLDRMSLETVAQYRRTEAEDDPLTHCMLAYPGPIGSVADDEEHRYAVCSPPNPSTDRSLLVWNPAEAELVHNVNLSEIVEADTQFTAGVANPDRSFFYAVNIRTMRVAEIDMRTGEVMREQTLLPDEDEPDSSTLDRLFEWVFGADPDSPAETSDVEPTVAISPDGQTMYVIAAPEGREPGVLVIDLENLEIRNSLMTGEIVDGLVATADNRVAVVERGEDGDGDRITILDNEGQTHASFNLPGRADVSGNRPLSP